MAYANPLDPTTPSGGANANQLDDRIRECKAALVERLLTLVTDVNLDPLVLKPSVVSQSSIADNAINQAKMADASVGTAELIDRNITAIKIALLAITAAEIADSTITQLKMADNSVGTAEIIDANVTNAKLAANAVTQSKMADDSVGTAEIIDANVTTAKILDANVTTPKIADDNVTEPKLSAALRGAVLEFVSGQRTLTQAETSLATDQYREYDVTCTGAIVGDRPVIAYWTATNYPTTGAADATGGWIPGDEMRLDAWCIAADKIRIRFFNRTGSTIDMGATGASVRVFQLKRLTD